MAYEPEARALLRSVLGNTADDHARVAMIRKGVWQAARSLGDFSLVGCSVGPGFEFEDFRFVASVSGHRAHFEDKLVPWLSLRWRWTERLVPTWLYALGEGLTPRFEINAAA